MQNIDLMNLAGFCRNCLSNWMKEAADSRGVTMSKDESREAIYGMPQSEWKARHQAEATPEQLARMDASVALNTRLRAEREAPPGVGGA